MHTWRELAAFLFLPADVIWMTGWFCLLTDGQATLPVGEIYLTLVLVNVLAYLMLKMLFAWKAPVVLRLALGGLGLLSVAWMGESLLVYQGLIFDFNRILQDIWSSFRGARGLSLEFWSLACCIFLWVRAIFYTRSPVTQDTIMSRLQFGIFMFLILVLIYTGLNLADYDRGSVFVIDPGIDISGSVPDRGYQPSPGGQAVTVFMGLVPGSERGQHRIGTDCGYIVPTNRYLAQSGCDRIDRWDIGDHTLPGRAIDRAAGECPACDPVFLIKISL